MAFLNIQTNSVDLHDKKNNPKISLVTLGAVPSSGCSHLIPQKAMQTLQTWMDYDGFLPKFHLPEEKGY